MRERVGAGPVPRCRGRAAARSGPAAARPSPAAPLRVPRSPRQQPAPARLLDVMSVARLQQAQWRQAAC